MRIFTNHFRLNATRVLTAVGLAVACLTSVSLAELPVTSGNVLWLTADAGLTVGADGRVTSWADQSGNGYDAVALGYGPQLLENGSPSGELNLLNFILDGSAMSIATLGTLPGDANRDGTVDAADAATLSENWLTATGAYWAQGDFNADGAVNDIDATLLAVNWGATSPPSLLDPGTSGFTVFVAGSPWDDASSRALLSKADGTSSRNTGYSVWANVASAGTNVRMTGGPVPDPDYPEDYRASQSIAMSPDVQVITMSATGTNGGTQTGYVTGYRDGVGGWTDGGNGPADNQYIASVTSSSDLYIGGFGYIDDEDNIHAAYPHRGTIGEIIIYDRELSAAERASVESYLVNRWSGAAPQPTQLNTYYDFNEDLTDGRTVYDQIDGVHGSLGRRLNDEEGTLIQSLRGSRAA